MRSKLAFHEGDKRLVFAATIVIGTVSHSDTRRLAACFLGEAQRRSPGSICEAIQKHRGLRFEGLNPYWKVGP